MNTFTADTITDQKRLARGEYLLRARTALRRRDHIHNRAWRFLILAGAEPAEEINAIRSLFPKAHITAVDRDAEAVDRACAAGADAVIHSELIDTAPTYRIADAVRPSLREADCAILDLCTNCNPESERLFRYAWTCIHAGSVLIFNVSYGRDVVEAFGKEEWRGLDEVIGPRVRYLTSSVTRMSGGYEMPGYFDLCSVIAYMGAMPMISTFTQKKFWSIENPDFVRLGPGDFELAVTQPLPDASMLYATTQERIEALRRSQPALKAAYTRKAAAEMRKRLKPTSTRANEQQSNAA